MLVKPTLLSSTVGVLLACSSPSRSASHAPPPVTPATKQPAPAPATAKAAGATDSSAPAPKPVAVVLAPVPRPGPPRKTVRGAGIRIVEASDGRVTLKATTTWGEALDTTYSDCSYYNAAVPVLTTQLAAAAAKLLPKMCAPAGEQR